MNRVCGSRYTHNLLSDCLFLSLVIALSLVLYVRDLGFYSDDWAWLGWLSTSQDQSFSGLYNALYTNEEVMHQRPVQIFLMAGLYWLFGLQPLGYHLFNGAVILSSTLLFYLIIRELGQPRLLALAVPIVYALLPNYSADRLWVAAFQAPVSMALYFLSLYSDLRALRHRFTRILRWQLLSMLALFGSGLAYEVAVPLFLLNPLLIRYRMHQLYEGILSQRTLRATSALFLGSNLLAVGLVSGFKVLTSIRLGSGEPDYVRHVAKIVRGAIRMNYGIYGIGLPYVATYILEHYRDWSSVALGGGLVGIILVYLYRLARQPEMTWPTRATWLVIVALSSIVFALGYVIMLSTGYIPFKSIGVDNRTAIAACIGVAMSFVGVAGYVTSFLSSPLLRAKAFCLWVAVLCLSGFLINNTIATFWITAYEEEQRILAAIHKHFPTLPAGSTIMLDQRCLKIGPATVFASDWDLIGAVRMLYRDRSLHATVVMPHLKVGEDAISNYISHTWYGFPYSETLFLYNTETKAVYQFKHAEAARSYFQIFDPKHLLDCPGEFGWGRLSAWNDW
jgi:hypothetical protein